jgi:hypothetical protein
MYLIDTNAAGFLTMTNEKIKRARLMLSLPETDKFWLHQLANENCTSANAEIVRSVKERRERLEAEQRAAG